MQLREDEDGGDGDAGADEEEEKRRRERLERQKWIKDSDNVGGGDDGEALMADDEDSQFFNMATKAVKSMQRRKQPNPKHRKPQKDKTFKSPKTKMPLKTLVS